MKEAIKHYTSDNFFRCLIIVIIIYISIFSLIVIINWKNRNCYYEKYYEYPCKGATHYARVHRNTNKSCERYKRICE